MRPFPRQEMQAAGWPVALIEYFYQIDGAIRRGTLLPPSDDGEGAGLALLALSRGEDNFEPPRAARTVELVDPEMTVAVQTASPEPAPETPAVLRDILRRLAAVENEAF